MLIEQPVRGKGLPYWSNLHESLAALLETVLGQMRRPEEKKYLERCVRDFLATPPGQWLAEAVHGEIPAPQAQEEPSGAPAPADHTDDCRVHLPMDGNCTCGFEKAQPPAPASPGGRERLIGLLLRYSGIPNAGDQDPYYQDAAKFVDRFLAAPEAGAPGTQGAT